MAEQARLVQHGFTNIEVEKSKLLEIIKANRDKHVGEYNKAVVSYETAKLAYAQEYWAQLAENIVATKKILDDKLESVAAAVLMARETNQKPDGVIDLKNVNISVAYNLNPKVQIAVSPPTSHEKDYSVAIRGLELSTAEFVYLDQSNFSKYVLDEWDWKPIFANNISVLSSGTYTLGNSYFSNDASGIAFSGCSTFMPVLGSGISINNIGSSQNQNAFSVGDFDFESSYSSGASITESSNLGANSMALFNDILNSTKKEEK